jgi:3-phytase
MIRKLTKISIFFSLLILAGNTWAASYPVDMTLMDAEALDQDDMCVWIHPYDNDKSLIIVSDKGADKIITYDLDGKTVQVIPDVSHPGNIDLRYHFELGGEKVALVTVNGREDSKVFAFKVDATTRELTQVDDGNINTKENYSNCMYMRTEDDGTRKYYSFVNGKAGNIEQFLLEDDGTGKVKGTKVRDMNVESISEGCVADDELDIYYLGEENVGVWAFDASEDGSTTGELILPISSTELEKDVEGMAIYYAADHQGYLIVSSQGANKYDIFERLPPNKYVTTFGMDGVGETDGIEVVNQDLNSEYNGGMFLAHNNSNANSVEVISWKKVIAGEDLISDATYWKPQMPPAVGIEDRGALLSGQKGFKVISDRQGLHMDVPFDSHYAVEITDIRGNVLEQFKGSAGRKYTWDHKGNSGLYIVRLRLPSSTLTQKVVVTF